MFSREHFHSTVHLEAHMLCMLTNSEHQFIKAFLLQPDMLAVFESALSVGLPLFLLSPSTLLCYCCLLSSQSY